MLSSGVLSEELSILPLLLSVLGYSGFQDHADCYSFLLFLSSCSFSAIPILGGSLTLYTSFQSILTLHLLIMQVITRVLVPSAGVLFSPLGIWATGSRIVLGNVSRPFGLSLSVLGRFSLLSAGLEPSIKWVGVVKFFGPTI